MKKTLKFNVKNLFSIEFNDTMAKVSVFTKKGTGYDFNSTFAVAIPDNVIVDGQVNDATTLTSVLQSALADKKQYKESSKGVVVAINSTKIVSREVSLPKMDDKKLKSVVELNAQEYFPVDLTGYKVQHQVLEVLNDSKTMRVLVTVAPKSLTLEYAKVSTGVGLTLLAIDHVNNAIYHGLKKLSTKGDAMFVNINLQNTLVTFMRDDNLILQRSFPFGGDEFISTLVEAGNLHETDISSVINNASNEQWVNSILSTDMKDGLYARLINGIVRSLDFYKSSTKGGQPERIILMGDCSHIAGILETVSGQTGIQTSSIEDLPEVAAYKVKKTLLPIYLATFGAYLSPINLTPDDYLKNVLGVKTGKSPLSSGRNFIIITAVGAVLYSAFSFYQLTTITNERDQIQARVDELEYVREEYNTYLEYTAMMDSFTMIEDNIDKPNKYIVEFIEELEVKVPTSTEVMSATFDNTQVSLRVVVGSMEEAAVFVDTFREFESIEVISVSSFTEKQDTDLVEFSIVGTFVSDEVEETVTVDPATTEGGTQ